MGLVYYIYLHLVDLYGKCSYMDLMGIKLSQKTLDNPNAEV